MFHYMRQQFPVVLYSQPLGASGSAKMEIGAGEEQVLLARAEPLLRDGDFEAARLIYRELADRGSRRAAFRMAQTFDPEVLKAFFVVGLSPDLETARHWYRRAAELGAVEAEERLRRLAIAGSK